MRTGDDLPGRWIEARLLPAPTGAGLGPALGWLAGVLAAGGPLWPWPYLGRLLLGLFLTGAVWGRLWILFGEEAASADNPSHGSPSPGERHPAEPAEPPEQGEPTSLPFRLPYTIPGSLSAEWAAALARAWARLREAVERRRPWLLEALGLTALLLLVGSLWGRLSLLTAAAGLALLLLRRLLRGRPAAVSLLRACGGLAWPWWLGHTAWGPLAPGSLLLSLLWGVAYAGWAETARVRAAGRPLLWTDLAQGATLAFFLLAGRPVVGGVLAFTLLGQVLLQAGLRRAGREEAIASRTWLLAAAGMLLSAVALGGWL